MISGMDIFNRPPTIAEDTLHYTLRPKLSQSSKASVTSLAALIHAFAQQLLPNFIWHRDPFELKAARDDNGYADNASKRTAQTEDSVNQSGWYLEGRMRVGDSVDDEWCVVWLLWQVSSHWEVAISVNDSDGEFILIEAADYIPAWVEPSNAENRVWIYKSKFHLIPLSNTSPRASRPTRHTDENDKTESSLEESDEGYISIPDALKVLWSEDDETEAPRDMQEAVVRRISGYPEATLQHTHVTKAFLPVDIAKALSCDPTLVQKAAEAFYTRDAIQLRAAQRMSRFSPQHSILTTLKITRTAYAQLVGQRFRSPKVFGPIAEPEGTREWKWKDFGMKIACGFEMLFQESKERSSATNARALVASADARLDALRRNSDYTEYIKQLVSAGYFKSEREGSALWNELERKAVDVFVKTRSSDGTSRPSFASLVNDAIARADDNSSVVSLSEEPDDWLDVDAENFDAKIAESMRTQGLKREANHTDAMDVDITNNDDAVAQVQAEKLKRMAKKIENFVEGEGTLEGAVVDDDVSSDDEKLSDFSDDDMASDSDATDDNMDKEEAARLEAMNKLVDGIEPSDYGKMPPSFYSNSQPVAPVTMESEGASSMYLPDKGTSNPDGSPSKKQPGSPRTSNPMRRPILPRDNFDGVDSDDESDAEDPDQGNSDEEEEDRPQVVGDVEIDMEQEEEEFLSFSRKMLGISDEQWRDILRERQGRGAFVPSVALDGELTTQTALQETYQIQTQSVPGTQASNLEAGTKPKANSIFGSFDEVMDAMEAELAKARTSKKGTPNSPPASQKHTTALNTRGSRPSTVGDKGKAPQRGDEDKAADDDSDNGEMEAAMDAELRAALAREDSDSEEDQPMDYKLMKNFLESFKSQAGLSGPVSNLAGRLEPAWKLPRDET